MTDDRIRPPDPRDFTPALPADAADGVVWVTAVPRRRFQHRYTRHVVLFLLTLATTTLAGSCHYAGFEFSTAATEPDLSLTWGFLAQGLWYSLPLLAILGAHEFGHYVYCRRHRVDATLPYFLPAPIPLTGTLGAVIRIREAFPSKQALFDIGVAGPIAGFVALIPFLYWGLALSDVIRFPESADLIYFGEPLLFKALAWLRFGPIPEGHDIVLHPLGFAAWFGMLATALNLLPFGQLDGGHIAYSILGRRASRVSLGTLVAAVVLTLQSAAWIAVTIMMLVMAMVLGLRHPTVIDEHLPLDSGRQAVAVLAVVMFALCFTPIPIEMFVTP